MRICFVTTAFVEKGKPKTGLPNYLYRLSKALMSMGHEVAVVVCGRKDRREEFEGIIVWRCRADMPEFENRELSYLVSSFNVSRALNCKVKELWKEGGLDIVQYTNLLGTGIFCPAEITSVLRLSSYAKIYFGSYQTYTKSYVRVISWVERLSARKMNGIFGPSRVMAEAFGRDVHRKVQVIETPFQQEPLELDESVYRDKLEGKKYILFFGSIYEEKGLLIIRDMIHRFLECFPEYYYVFVGETQGGRRRNIMAEIREAAGEYQERIIYSRALMHEQLYPVIRHAQVVTLPSLMENFSNACLESMSFERIVIGTDGTSFEQLIRDGVNGYLARPGDADSLYHKLREALSLSGSERLRMGQRAAKRIKRLSPEIAVVRLVKYYEAVIENREKKK